MDKEFEKIQEEMKKMKVKDFGLMFIQTLSTVAWQKMGLVPNPEGQEEMELNEAKLAIDMCSSIFDVIKDSLDEGPKNDLANLISNLKINFVEKNK
jgi:hypothetical protein